MPYGRVVFVTVGSTKFEGLVSAVSSIEFVTALKRLGFGSLRIQYGHGREPEVPPIHEFNIEKFAFKPSINDEIAAADLVISHAGLLCMLSWFIIYRLTGEL